MGDLTDIRDRITRLSLTAGLPPDVWSELCKIDSEFRAALRAQTADTAPVREAVREYAIKIIGGYLGAGLSSATVEAVAYAIADRAAAQLTAPPPGHVCPAPYDLGPDDLELLEGLWNWPAVKRAPRTRELLHRIIAAHRAPELRAGPLPEIIACGTEGCVSSIRKAYLPSGWVMRDGTWRCPRCKVVATTEAS